MHDDMLKFARRFMRALDTPRALTVEILLRNGEWDQLSELRVDPRRYDQFEIDRYRRDALATNLLRKANFLPTSKTKAMLEQAAVDRLLLTENQCFCTNRRFDAMFGDHPVLVTKVEEAAYELLLKARAFIKRALGSLPTNLDGRFGPGAVFENKTWCFRDRKITTAYTKLKYNPSRTAGVCSLLVDHVVRRTALRYAWADGLSDAQFPYVRGDRFVTVDKTSTERRGIGIGPGLNVWCQLAVGDAMKTRLKRIGLDLSGYTDSFGRWCSGGQELHRRMAREASLTGAYATVDLSNASNTVAFQLVKALLPTDWFDLLNALRSQNLNLTLPTGQGKKKKSWLRLEMFSAMGNGYTFELETLIFAALCHACGGKVGQDSFVYGDDIIVPTEIVKDVLALLQFCGFTPNKEKTFTHPLGPFRESCGGDYLHGHDCRPIYIKEEPNEPSSLVVVANQLFAWGDRFLLPELGPVRSFILDSIPTRIRSLRGPQALGDLLIHDTPDNWRCRVINGRRTFTVWKPVFDYSLLYRRQAGYDVCNYTSGVAMAAALLGLPSNGLVPRDGVKGYKMGRVVYS